MNEKILILPTYVSRAGSSRYMLYDYLPYFKQYGYDYDVLPLLDEKYLHYVLDKSELSFVENTELYLHLIRLYFKRLTQVLKKTKYDAVIIQKELLPFIPYSLEAWLVSKLGPLILTYDEPSYLKYQEHKFPFVNKFFGQKMAQLMAISKHIITWNNEVKAYAHQFNTQVSQLGLGFDLKRYQVKEQYELDTPRPMRIGWMGTPSGFPYVHLLDDVFRKLSQKHQFELMVVSSVNLQIEGVVVDNRKWSLNSEIADLLAMDVGIMPLPEDEWATGKSGCKMLQYMGVGTPAVVSPVGINGEIIQHGVNGFIARSHEEWYTVLDQLLSNAQLRQNLGQTGRKYVEAHHDQAKNAEQLIQILQQVIQPQ
jgi:glycosyltransferase involved in cell wall biosynthesis